MAKSNKILLARGRKSVFEGALLSDNKLAGMPFYDIETKDVYIVDTDDGETGKNLERIGGKEVLVYKGHCTVDGTHTAFKEWETEKLETLKVGDAYFADQALNADENGITVGKGDLIVYTGAELEKFSNILYNGKWLRINCGKISAKDVIIENETGDTNVYEEITNIMSGKLQYLGEVKNLTDAENSNSLAQLTSQLYIEDNPFSSDDDENKGTAVALKPGYFIYYVGNDVKVFDNQTIYKYSFIMNEQGTYHVIKIGASGGAELKFKFGSKRNATAENIRLTEDAKTDGDVATVDEALNNLMSSKADLLANGKIPLSQIPDTLVGALQFKGTVDVSELIEAAGSTADPVRLVEFLSDKFNAKGENRETDLDDDGINGVDAIDAGDYFILNDLAGNVTITIDGKVYGKGDWLIYNGENKFEQLNASSAVDSINGITAAVNITGSTRDELVEVGVSEKSSTITIAAPNAVLEDEAVPEGRLLLSGANKTAINSSLKVEAPLFTNENSDLLKTHGTKITDKEGISVEFPYATSRIAGIEYDILKKGKTKTVEQNVSFKNKLDSSATKYKIITPYKNGDGIPFGPYLTIKGYKEGEETETGEVEVEAGTAILQVSSDEHPIIKFNNLLKFTYDQEEKQYVSNVVKATDAPEIATLTAITENSANTNALPKFTANDTLTKSVISDDETRVKFGDNFAVDYTKNIIEETKSVNGEPRNFYHKLPTTGESKESPNLLLDEESTINGGLWM